MVTEDVRKNVILIKFKKNKNRKINKINNNKIKRLKSFIYQIILLVISKKNFVIQISTYECAWEESDLQNENSTPKIISEKYEQVWGIRNKLYTLNEKLNK